MSKLTDEQLTEIFRYSFSLIDSRMTPNQQAFCRAIEAAATEPLLQRIAELEQRNRDLYEDVQRFRKHALNEKAARLELERQLDEALKDAEPVRRMKQRADELIAAFENAPDGKALDMQKGQS